MIGKYNDRQKDEQQLNGSKIILTLFPITFYNQCFMIFLNPPQYSISLLTPSQHTLSSQSKTLHISSFNVTVFYLLSRAMIQLEKQYLKILSKLMRFFIFSLLIFMIITLSKRKSNQTLLDQIITYPKTQKCSFFFSLFNENSTHMTFYEFKQKYRKRYQSEEQEIFRSMVYYKNVNKIKIHNNFEQKSFTMQVNGFADLTPLQFSFIYNTLYQSNDQVQSIMGQIIKDEQLRKQRESKADVNLKIVYAQQRKNRRQQVFQLVQKTKINRYHQLKMENPQYISLDSVLFNHYQTLTHSYPILLTQPLRQSLSTQSQAQQLIIPHQNIIQEGNFTSDFIDWTLHAGTIRYQGICGACYTFATSDTVASLYSIYKFGFFVPLSTQQVIDCSTNGLTYGCNGGFLQGSYAYMQIRGIQTDKVYPYVSQMGISSQECKISGGSFKVTQFKNIDEGDCKTLVNQLAYGPVSIGIAGYRLQFYSQGIFNDCNSYIDHAVVLIGYKGGVGWKIKNSWGSQWGMEGFAWIQDGNNCGICNMGVVARIQT